MATRSVELGHRQLERRRRNQPATSTTTTTGAATAPRRRLARCGRRPRAASAATSQAATAATTTAHQPGRQRRPRRATGRTAPRFESTAMPPRLPRLLDAGERGQGEADVGEDDEQAAAGCCGSSRRRTPRGDRTSQLPDSRATPTTVPSTVASTMPTSDSRTVLPRPIDERVARPAGSGGSRCPGSGTAPGCRGSRSRWGCSSRSLLRGTLATSTDTDGDDGGEHRAAGTPTRSTRTSRHSGGRDVLVASVRSATPGQRYGGA